MSLFNNKSILINADCLEALSKLEDNSVHLVYMDPPWNTGKDFVYYSKDKSNDDSINYNNLIFKVIQQAHRVLKTDGNLIIYSVPSLNTNFHNLVKPIFGDENFRAEFIIPIKKMNFGNKSFQHTHETVICYSRSSTSQFFPLIEKNKEEIEKLFPLNDNGRNFKLQPIALTADRPNLRYNWKGFELPIGKVWRYSESKMNELEEKGNIYYKEDFRLPYLKIYSDERNDELISSIWNDIKPYDISSSFPGQQSSELLDRIIKLFSLKNDIILDPFAGSLTSGISSIKNERKWIGIESSVEVIEIAKRRINNEKVKLIQNADLDSFDVIWDNYISFNLSDSEIILEKIKKGENERVELKESYNFSHFNNLKDDELPKKVMQEIASFINSKYGGTIILGVKDDGSVLGLEMNFKQLGNKKNQDGFELALISKLRNSFGGLSVDLIAIQFHEIESKIICEIKISPNEEPVFLNGEFFVRNGTQCNNLKNQEFFELMIKRKKT